MDHHPTSPPLFSETQRIRQWWIWAIMIVVNGFMLFLASGLVVPDEILQEESEAIWFRLVIVLPGLLAMLLLYITKLETEIRMDGVYIRYFPFHFKFQRYGWEEIHKAYVKKYYPLRDYGGWGIRYAGYGMRIGGKERGKAFSVSGNHGLQLELKNGKRRLIGTNMPKELEELLGKLYTTDSGLRVY